MAKLSDAFRGMLSPEDLSVLEEAVDSLKYKESVETVTSGAISVDKKTTFVSVDGSKSYTLADGTSEGQLKMLVCTSATNTPSGTITPDNFADGSTITMDAVNESVLLQWNSSTGWKVVSNESATVA